MKPLKTKVHNSDVYSILPTSSPFHGISYLHYETGLLPLMRRNFYDFSTHCRF